MVTRIILRLDEDGTLHKEDVIPFRDIKHARECYRAGQLEIRKCTGPPSSQEIMAAQHSRSKELEERLNKSLTEMENALNTCDINTINVSNDITKNLTLVDEGIKVGLLYSVDKNKIDNMKNRFNFLKSQFIDNCRCNSK